MKVMEYATHVCEELGLERLQRIDIELAAKFHDIGKIKFSPEMLDERKKFTKKEFERFKKHAKYGYDILKNFYGDDSIASLVLYSHEKMDGTGYPKGLKGENIPLGSRIITVCDSYDAMFRHYSKKTKEEAIQELIKGKGKHFDEKIVDIFLRLI